MYTRKKVPIKKRASSFTIIVCHPCSFGSHFCSNMFKLCLLSLLGFMTEHYSNGLARMDLKADTTVTIQVDSNKGWYAYDFLCAYPRGDGLGRRVKMYAR